MGFEELAEAREAERAVCVPVRQLPKPLPDPVEVEAAPVLDAVDLAQKTPRPGRERGRSRRTGRDRLVADQVEPELPLLYGPTVASPAAPGCRAGNLIAAGGAIAAGSSGCG